MPPIRTVSSSKPLKTERTHEENQERAYIAASRRSDRSLEARIESARRASEIHKKRTGRALRVTEQDVVNEEMYEEEDDGLPAQIRRLQSLNHLQTNSLDFNRRLQAYMSSQMGTRTALIEQGNTAPLYPSAPFFANHFVPPHQTTMLPPHMLHYPNSGCQSGQYSASAHNFVAHGEHHRSTSISTPQEFANHVRSSSTSPQSESQHQRRLSMPAHGAQSPHESQLHSPTKPSLSRTASNVDHGTGGSSMPLPHGASSQAQDYPSAMPLSATTAPLYDSGNMSFAPFSTSLPQETQQLLVTPASTGTFNPNWMFANSSPTSYSYKPNSINHVQNNQALSIDSMLPMPSLDTDVYSPASAGYATSANTDYGLGLTSESLRHDDLKLGNMTRSSSGGGSSTSGLATPGGVDWQNFLETYDDVPAQ